MVDLPGFDKQQLKKAVKSLLKYVGEQQESGPAQLIEEDELLHLVVALKKAPVGPRKDKPIRLPIPHPLFTADGAEICLFVKDHKGEGHKAAKARLAKLQKNGGVHKVGGGRGWHGGGGVGRGFASMMPSHFAVTVHEPSQRTEERRPWRGS